MSGKSIYPRFIIKLPWWFDLMLAALVYYVFKYWLPTIHLQHSQLNNFLHALPQYAEIFAGILVVNAIISFMHTWGNSRRDKSSEKKNRF